MSDLAKFLLARVRDVERIAARSTMVARSSRELSDHWQSTDARDWRTDVRDANGQAVARCSAGVAAHIACHDPARVLAECEVKRQIVEHVVKLQDGMQLQDGLVVGSTDDTVLRLMALPYADHPDYRSEWHPLGV